VHMSHALYFFLYAQMYTLQCSTAVYTVYSAMLSRTWHHPLCPLQYPLHWAYTAAVAAAAGTVRTAAVAAAGAAAVAAVVAAAAAVRTAATSCSVTRTVVFQK
jgi:hypothetical protein